MNEYSLKQGFGLGLVNEKLYIGPIWFHNDVIAVMKPGMVYPIFSECDAKRWINKSEKIIFILLEKMDELEKDNTEDNEETSQQENGFFGYNFTNDNSGDRGKRKLIWTPGMTRTLLRAICVIWSGQFQDMLEEMDEKKRTAQTEKLRKGWAAAQRIMAQEHPGIRFSARN